MAYYLGEKSLKIEDCEVHPNNKITSDFQIKPSRNKRDTAFNDYFFVVTNDNDYSFTKSLSKYFSLKGFTDQTSLLHLSGREVYSASDFGYLIVAIGTMMARTGMWQLVLDIPINLFGSYNFPFKVKLDQFGYLSYEPIFCIDNYPDSPLKENICKGINWLLTRGIPPISFKNISEA